MEGEESHLVCDGQATLDVEESISVAIISLVSHMELLDPFRAYFAKPLLLSRIVLCSTV